MTRLPRPVVRSLASCLCQALWLVPCVAQPAANPPAPVTAAATVEPATFIVGAVTRLEITAEFARPPDRIELDLAPLAPTFEVRAVTGRRSWGARRHWIIEMTSFAPGAQAVPPLTIHGRFGAGPEVALARTAAVAVTVTSPVVQANDPLQPLVDRLDPPPWPLWLRLTGWIMSALTAAALVSVVVIRARRLVERRRLARAFWTATIERMRQLAAEAGRSHPGAVRPLLHTAAAVIKTALAAAVDPRLRGRSSAGVRALLNERATPQSLSARSVPILEALDRQRFAAQVPSAQAKATLTEGVALVESLPRRLRIEDPR